MTPAERLCHVGVGRLTDLLLPDSSEEFRNSLVERGPNSLFLHDDVPNDHEIFIVIGGSFNILKPPGAVKSTMHNSVSGSLILVEFSASFFTGNKCA